MCQKTVFFFTRIMTLFTFLGYQNPYTFDTFQMMRLRSLHFFENKNWKNTFFHVFSKTRKYFETFSKFVLQKASLAWIFTLPDFTCHFLLFFPKNAKNFSWKIKFFKKDEKNLYPTMTFYFTVSKKWTFLKIKLKMLKKIKTRQNRPVLRLRHKTVKLHFFIS